MPVKKKTGPKTGGMNSRQKRFADEMVRNGGNKSQAAKDAGYSKKNPGRCALAVLAGNPAVREYIAKKQAALALKADVRLDDVCIEYARIGFSDIRDYFNADGEFIGFEALTPEAAAAVAGVDFENGKVKRIRLWPKREALDGLMRHLGGFAPERHQLVDEKGGPVKFLIEYIGAAKEKNNA